MTRDLLAMLAAALAGDAAASGQLGDALKEAGLDAAAGKLAALLGLKDKALAALAESRREHDKWEGRDEGSAEFVYAEWSLEAWEKVLGWLGEEVPDWPESEGDRQEDEPYEEDEDDDEDAEDDD